MKIPSPSRQSFRDLGSDMRNDESCWSRFYLTIEPSWPILDACWTKTSLDDRAVIVTNPEVVSPPRRPQTRRRLGPIKGDRGRGEALEGVGGGEAHKVCAHPLCSEAENGPTRRRGPLPPASIYCRFLAQRLPCGTGRRHPPSRARLPCGLSLATCPFTLSCHLPLHSLLPPAPSRHRTNPPSRVHQYTLAVTFPPLFWLPRAIISSADLGLAGELSGEPLGWDRPPQTASLLASLNHLARGDSDASVRAEAQNLLFALEKRGFLTGDGSPRASCAAQRNAGDPAASLLPRWSVHQGPYYPHVWDAMHPTSEPPSVEEVRKRRLRGEIAGWQVLQAGLSLGPR